MTGLRLPPGPANRSETYEYETEEGAAIGDSPQASRLSRMALGIDDHSYKLCQRLGLHFFHHPGTVNFDRPFTDSEMVGNPLVHIHKFPSDWPGLRLPPGPANRSETYEYETEEGAAIGDSGSPTRQ